MPLSATLLELLFNFELKNFSLSLRFWRPALASADPPGTQLITGQVIHLPSLLLLTNQSVITLLLLSLFSMLFGPLHTRRGAEGS